MFCSLQLFEIKLRLGPTFKKKKKNFHASKFKTGIYVRSGLNGQKVDQATKRENYPSEFWTYITALAFSQRHSFVGVIMK